MSQGFGPLNLEIALERIKMLSQKRVRMSGKGSPECFET
jgi:hypothetical protein